MLQFDPFESFFRPISSGTRTGSFLPPADVAVGDESIVLTLDLPGLAVEDVEIEVLDDTLTVRGERTPVELPEGTTFTHFERGFGRFERTVRLPAGVDPDAVTAKMESGVLTLVVPKPERVKPRQIAVESGSERKELATA